MEDNITERFNYFRETRIWPLEGELDFRKWLDNFTEGEERMIAQKILDFFIYIPDRMVNQMLATVIGKCGYYFKKERGIWKDSDFQNNCLYSFIPGEEQKPTDSGYVFNRKLRDQLRIPETSIVNFDELHKILARENNKNVILVDDFVGSGHQTMVAWLLRRDKDTGLTLQEATAHNGHHIIYAPLVVNYLGFNRIASCCTGLGLTFVHLLDERCSLFHKDCPCWEGDSDLYAKAIKLIEEKSLSLGIKDTAGAFITDLRGFAQQGLAIAFEHCMPDACPPIFYWETEQWKPLMKKVYHRD